jgi:hypothetical protein
MTKHLRKLLRGVLGLLLIIIFSSPEVRAVPSEKGKPDIMDKIGFVSGSILLGSFGAGAGYGLPELFAIMLRSKQEVDPCGKLQRIENQRLLAVSATIGLMVIWNAARSEMLGKSDDLIQGIIRTILTYAGGTTGARIAVNWLCGQPQLIKEAEKIIAITAISTGLGAALGFNLIW